MAVQGDRVGMGCPPHPGGPIGMAHDAPQQLLGQKTAFLPIKPLLSPGHVWGGETPPAGGESPKPFPWLGFCIPIAPLLRSCASPQWPLLAALPAPAALPQPLPQPRPSPPAAEVEKFIPVKTKSILAAAGSRGEPQTGDALPSMRQTSYPRDALGCSVRDGWRERDCGGVT